MWTCQNCENQSEENFKFCWSCGKPRSYKNEPTRGINTAISFAKQTEDEPKRNIPQVKAIEKEEKSRHEPAKGIEEKDPEITIIEPIKPEPVLNEIKQKPQAKAEETQETRQETAPSKTRKIREPELFGTFMPESERGNFSNNAETDWETVIFTSAVRLVGLYFIFLVLTAIPDFVSAVYFFSSGQNPEITSLSDLFATTLFFVTAKILFYLLVGIYLIASGRFLLWFLPRS